VAVVALVVAAALVAATAAVEDSMAALVAVEDSVVPQALEAVVVSLVATAAAVTAVLLVDTVLLAVTVPHRLALEGTVLPLPLLQLPRTPSPTMPPLAWTRRPSSTSATSPGAQATRT
jgi:hypothetical protein